MNVCILSMQHVDNYGSLLQSYALSKHLQNLGCNVSFLPIEYRKNDYNLISDYDRKVSIERETGKKIDKYIINRINNKIKYRKLRIFFNEFRSEFLTPSNGNEIYDLCIIGSDEVFNCMQESYWGYTSQLFGNVTQAKRVITYAASCGSTTLAGLPKKVLENISIYLPTIDQISVRDENTKEFVEGITKKTPMIHFDPVITYDFSKEINMQNLPIDFSKKCIIYSYNNRMKNENEYYAILGFCHKNNMEPVFLGGYQFWSEKFLPLTPFQLLRAFSEAAFIITDTFHGSIFASKYSKRFGIIVRDSNRNKLIDLIKKLHLEKHVIRSKTLKDVYDVFGEENDFSLSELIQKQAQSNTIEYLKRSLDETAD